VHNSSGVTPEEPSAIDRFRSIGDSIPSALASWIAASTPISFSRRTAPGRDGQRLQHGVGAENVPS
jgi:hypothetical protein